LVVAVVVVVVAAVVVVSYGWTSTTRDLFLLRNVQTDLEAHPPPQSIGKRVLFRGVKWPRN
jgi:hypothetical protein